MNISLQIEDVAETNPREISAKINYLIKLSWPRGR